MTEMTPASDKPLRIPGWIIGLSCAVLVAGGVSLYWMDGKGMEDDLRLAKTVYEGRSDASAESLRKCLKGDGKGLVPGADKVWSDMAGGRRGYNPARHLFVDIESSGEQRVVRVWTREGEELTGQDRREIEICLEG